MSSHRLHHGEFLAHRPPTWALVLLWLPILVAFCATEADSRSTDRRTTETRTGLLCNC